MAALITPGIELPVHEPTTVTLVSVESMATLTDGSYVITWTSTNPTSNADTYAQRFTATGEKIGDQIQVNTTRIDVQAESEVVALNDGGFVIIWVGAGLVGDAPLAGLYAQRYDATGAEVGAETRIVAGNITPRYFNTVAPAAVTLPDGGYVLAWAYRPGYENVIEQVLTQQFNADGSARGTAVEVDVTVTSGQYRYPSIAGLDGGGYVISWSWENDIYAQRFDASGAKVGSRIMVNTFEPDVQEYSVVAGLSDGGFVISWHSRAQTSAEVVDVYMQLFDAAGAKVGSETRVTSDGGHSKTWPKVTALTDGGYVIVYNSTLQDTPTSVGCYGQIFDAAGAKVGAEFLINTRTQETQYLPDVTALAGGGFVVAWYHHETGKPRELVQKIFAAQEPVTGTDQSDNLIGTPGNDVMDGLGGADTMTGGLGDDTYYLDNAGDKVNELHHQGTDTVYTSVSYSLFGRAIENLIMQGDGDLSVTANSLNNRLTGNAGNNSFDGGAGGDVMIGGLGNDTYYVDNIYDNVTELHHQGTDVVFASISYSLFGRAVETLTLTGNGNLNATGNSLNNTLTGTSGNNLLDGGTGGDLMTGGLGDDTYYVDNIYDNVAELHLQGTDTVISSISYSLFGRAVEVMTLTGAANINATGNSLANTLTGNTGNNQLDGGTGNDSLTGGLGGDVFLFNTATGKDTITDFNAAQNDVINIHAYTAGTADTALVKQVGGDVVIILGGGNSITVLGAIRANVLDNMVW